MTTATAIKYAKIRANYTCVRCGSQENIQAHHRVLGDDNSLVILCGLCHSKEHPDLSPALFLNKHYKQPSYIAKLAERIELHIRLATFGNWYELNKRIPKLKLWAENAKLRVTLYLREYRQRLNKAIHDLIYFGTLVPQCADCGGRHITRAGYGITVRYGKMQRYGCQDCARTFYSTRRLERCIT